MVQIFLDTASLTEIEEFTKWGIADGVTTNQKIFLSEGGVDFKKRVLDICNLVNGPISVETTKSTVPELIAEGMEYASWHGNIVVKVAMFGDGRGLQVVNQLAWSGVKTNMTVMMTFNQLDAQRQRPEPPTSRSSTTGRRKQGRTQCRLSGTTSQRRRSRASLRS